MRVLLTGGTGFLGGRVAECLAGAGHEVVLVARNPDSIGRSLPGIEVIQGDVCDVHALRPALEGCTAVVHLAAVVKRWARDRSLFDRVNVEATEALADLAAELGIRRFLHCSSFMALGPTDGSPPVNEDAQHDREVRNDYERTKLEADRNMRARQRRGEPITIIYPGIVYGPGKMTDGNILAGVAWDLLEGRLPGTLGPGDRRQCFAYVEDVAQGFLAALEHPDPGFRYILGGENLTVRQALVIMAEAGGVIVPRREIPYAVARMLGRMLRWRAHFFGIEPFLTDEEVRISEHEWAYDSSLAQHDLGYQMTPVHEGLSIMIRWLIDEKIAHVRRL